MPRANLPLLLPSRSDTPAVGEVSACPAGSAPPRGRQRTRACGRMLQLLAKHPDIRKLSFTGSTAVGKLLLEQTASTVKRVSLELVRQTQLPQ